MICYADEGLRGKMEEVRSVVETHMMLSAVWVASVERRKSLFRCTAHTSVPCKLPVS